MTDLAKQEPAAPGEERPLGDVEPDVIAADAPVTAVPLWRVRLRLMRRTLSRNWALFADNKIGFIGLAIIAVFALMAVLQPILIATVWDPTGLRSGDGVRRRGDRIHRGGRGYGPRQRDRPADRPVGNDALRRSR